MFSIVIPLYNKAKSIANTIQSILGQSFADFELIIVDDGSSDDSVRVVNQFTDKRIRLIQKENGGVCSARNVGILHAQYDYIALLDADDQWNIDYLLEQQKLINEFPQAIESKFSESGFIENIVVFGENKKFVAALISPDFVFLKSWCKKHKIPFTTPQEMVKNPLVVARYQREVKKINPNFGDWEQIKRFELIADEWTQNNVLTPTLKVKRNVVENMYGDTIEKLFA